MIISAMGSDTRYLWGTVTPYVPRMAVIMHSGSGKTDFWLSRIRLTVVEQPNQKLRLVF